uniref:Glycosyltransferase RgtA/B/C/D-like domain-containing protein n=1 Tax=Solibacter usitatus (strain Ellin6076) TaxID=234267 RepID=Q020A0_SOLUE
MVRGWVVALAVLNVVRAMTLPVTPGEAWNYDRFVAPPWREAFEHFDLNNHVLNTLLIRISTARFHLTELSLRLPSLLGGLLYLWVAYRIATRRFAPGTVAIAVLGLLTLNPMVLDGMSEARGYGMALALLLWALELMLESAETFSLRKFNLAAVCLGLSVSAALAFAAPASAMAAVFLGWGRGWVYPKGQGRVFVLLSFLSAFMLLAIPIDHTAAGAFMAGATSLRQSLNEISEISLGTSLKVVWGAVRIGFGLLAAGSLVAGVRMWRRTTGGLIVLTSATLSLTLVILLAANRWVHSRFPEGGAVYLVPLCTLVFTSILLKWKHKAAQVVLYAASFGLMALYLNALGFGTYAAGKQFAGGRVIAKKLRAEIGMRPARIGVSEAAEPVFNYYRTRLRQGNWERIERRPPTGRYDYYVLAGTDRTLVEERHLHVLYKDVGLTLAQ